MFPRAMLVALAWAPLAGAAELPIFDAHLHYSHDAWEMLPPAAAVEILRKAGVKRALVSSSGDEGQQRMKALAPDVVITELRPYRSRGEIGTWVRDETVPAYLEERLKKYRYSGIGEFHLYGADADLPVAGGRELAACRGEQLGAGGGAVLGLGRALLQHRDACCGVAREVPIPGDRLDHVPIAVGGPLHPARGAGQLGQAALAQEAQQRVLVLRAVDLAKALDQGLVPACFGQQRLVELPLLPERRARQQPVADVQGHAA